MHLALAGALMALGAIATRNAWADMFYISWNDEECGHALLAIPAFIWLAWIRRGRLRRCHPTGQWIGLVMIAIGWAAWSWGFRQQLQTLWHGGALLVVMGAFFSVAGAQVLKEFLAAFVILGFLVPVPSLAREKIALPMQRHTAYWTQLACETLGMDVTRDNSLLTTYGGVQVAIAEACNGMRMVFALIMVCYLFAFVSPLRAYVRFLLLALSPVVAAVCNIIRLVPTVFVYGHFSREFAEAFHDVTGWVMLVAAFLTMVGFLKLMRWAMLPVTHFRLVDVA